VMLGVGHAVEVCILRLVHTGVFSSIHCTCM
jgi:hypothetical protein